MIKSMTAFARAHHMDDAMEIAVEIRSYNSRYLDVALRIPHEYAALEDRVKKEAARFMTRGRLEIALSIQDTAESAGVYQVDHARARSFYTALKELKASLKMPGNIPFDLVANAPGLIHAQAPEKDLERSWQAVRPCLTSALADLEAMRLAEGRALRDDCLKHLQEIEGHLEAIEGRTTHSAVECRHRLEERISALIADKMAVDPARIAQEAALIAVKRDVTEEITRAKSHLFQFRQIMDSEAPAGKKLNFLLQEIHREFNTMSAKTEDAAVSHAVVEVKSALEKIREQMLNVE